MSAALALLGPVVMFQRGLVWLICGNGAHWDGTVLQYSARSPVWRRIYNVLERSCVKIFYEWIKTKASLIQVI